MVVRNLLVLIVCMIIREKECVHSLLFKINKNSVRTKAYRIYLS